MRTIYKIIALAHVFSIFSYNNCHAQIGYDFVNVMGMSDTIKLTGNTLYRRFGRKDDYTDNDPRLKLAGNDFRRKISVDHPVPHKLNDKKIFYDYKEQPKTIDGKPFSVAVLNAIENGIKQHNNGEYMLELTNITFDENGKMIYFDTTYTEFVYKDHKRDKDKYWPMKRLIAKTLNNMQMAAVYEAGKKVPFAILCPFLTVHIVVENGKVTYYNHP